MAEAAAQIPEDLLEADAYANRTRRLSDKILAAFNHAYATGQFEVAKQLHRALKLNEVRSHDGPDNRESYDPIGQAELWIAFVEARDKYKALCNAGKPAPRDAIEALDAMKEAYRRWSFA